MAGAPAFITWLNANGQQWISDDLRTVTINNEAGMQTLDFMQKMTEINYGIEEQNAFWESAGEFDQMAIILDLVSVQSTGSWALFQLESHAEDLNYEVAAVPYGPNGSPDRRGATWGGWGFMVPKNAAHPDEAWQLVSWLTTEVEGVGGCWFLQQQQRPSPISACDGYMKDGENASSGGVNPRCGRAGRGGPHFAGAAGSQSNDWTYGGRCAIRRQDHRAGACGHRSRSSGPSWTDSGKNTAKPRHSITLPFPNFGEGDDYCHLGHKTWRHHLARNGPHCAARDESAGAIYRR